MQEDIEKTGEPAAAAEAGGDAGSGAAAAGAGEAPGRVRRLLTRRRFLALGLFAAAAVAVPARCGFYAEDDGFEDLRQLSPTQGAIFMALLETLLPPFADRSPEALREHVRFIDGYLVGLPASEVRQLGLCLYAVEHATLPTGGRLQRFTRLDAAERQAYLYGWQTADTGLLRLGLRSLKSLAFLALYRTEAAFEAIGYSGPMVEEPTAGRERYAALRAPDGARPGDTWRGSGPLATPGQGG